MTANAVGGNLAPAPGDDAGLRSERKLAARSLHAANPLGTIQGMSVAS